MKKFNRYKTCIHIAEITEIILSSIATTAATTITAFTGIGLPYTVSTLFATATVYGSLSRTINTKMRKKIIKRSQIYKLKNEFGDKFKELLN